MEKKIKVKVIMAIIYGIIAMFLGAVTAGCVDGTATASMTWNVVISGILFAILALIEIEKAVKLANEM